ncbi:MAG TPA: hypothetical protein VGF04_10360 [Solirubrobacterales bacterium]|jgi:hypothetical protein
MSARKPKKSRGKAPASTSEAAERLAKIVDAAEQAAASVIDDAERQAQEQIDEAHERADRMVAERLREIADELDPGHKGEKPGGHLKPVEDVSEKRKEPAPEGRSNSAGARLLATQMAVSGAEREDIAKRLRSSFDIEDADEILDAILGPQEEE